MLKVYFTCLPGTAGNIKEEWRQCLDQTNSLLERGLIPVKLNIFADIPDCNDFLRLRDFFLQSVAENLKSENPAVSVIVQPPEKPYKIALEVTFIHQDSFKVTGKKYESIPYLVLESHKTKEVWAGGVSSYIYENNTQLAVEKAFGIASDILRNEGMTFDNIVRQWNYIGNILDVRNGIQNYQVFNDVRSDYYSRLRKKQSYPAATGVGTKHTGAILDFYAVESDESIRITAVDNPDQVNAYNYSMNNVADLSQEVLKPGQPPQFERALLIEDGKHTILHISGTASIIGQDTIGKGNIEKQINVTIGNIMKLTDTKRLGNLTENSSFKRSRFSLLRVYIKNRRDFPVVQSICNENFPDIPALYLEADICRNDLLIEMEAEVELE